jgi:predicted RNA binding protein with dsRBD fold (UPF0201 family)
MPLAGLRQFSGTRPAIFKTEVAKKKTGPILMIEVSLQMLIKGTESASKVASAGENIFPGLSMEVQGSRIHGHGDLGSLTEFHRLLREQRILDTARTVMLQGQIGDAIQFRLSKQAAFMGKVSFPPEEEPLGSIHVLIRGDSRLIDWLAPKTVDGKPIKEIELTEDYD